MAQTANRILPIQPIVSLIILKFNQNSMRSCLMVEWIIKYYVNEVNTIRKAKLFYRRPVLLAQGSSLKNSFEKIRVRSELFATVLLHHLVQVQHFQ